MAFTFIAFRAEAIQKHRKAFATSRRRMVMATVTKINALPNTHCHTGVALFTDTKSPITPRPLCRSLQSL